MTQLTTSNAESRRQPKCPSRFELADREANGRLGEISAHTAGCERCGVTLRELSDARRELLGGDADAISVRAAQRIASDAAERRKRRWRVWLPVGFAPVLAAVALVVTSGGAPRNAAVDGEAESAMLAGARAKGALVFQAFCKRGDQVFEVKEGADFYAGDRLRFAYTKGEPGHLIVFGVDDDGGVFPYYQDAILAGMPVAAGSHAMLPDSVELDEHKGWERVYALWSRQPIGESEVRAAVGRALASSANDLRQVTRLPFGSEVDQVSYLLHRP
jgi:hypothetical protein